MAKLVDAYQHTIKQEDVERIAKKYDIPTPLLLAIITIESSNNPFSVRAEPAYTYVWDCKSDRPFRKLTPPEASSSSAPLGFSACVGSIDTEWQGQKCSWGPMQVMGAVAREYGFLGHFPMLCGPLGIEYGARHLYNLAKRWKARYGWRGVVASFNAGTPRKSGDGFVNQRYVTKVFSEAERHGGL